MGEKQWDDLGDITSSSVSRRHVTGESVSFPTQNLRYKEASCKLLNTSPALRLRRFLVPFSSPLIILENVGLLYGASINQGLSTALIPVVFVFVRQ